ncbi:hypothetical protein QOZ80_8AG0635330 [Eleusine coracana subsp. coracana]|nr:hypothetical protein QOZ80_8AG0635330 [Eleusine coracana subsp. coracana]
MANFLAFTMLVLVTIAAMVAPFSHAAKSHAAKPFHGGAHNGVAEAPETNADGPAPATAIEWPSEGPKFVEMVIKNPFLAIPSPSPESKNSDGLPVDPTPEGSE